MGALQARAVTPTDSLRYLFSSARSESEKFEPSKQFQNERKIVVRRRRCTNLCNKAALYHKSTCAVKYLAYEPRTQIFTSMTQSPHVQQRIGPLESSSPLRQLGARLQQ